MRNNTLKSKLPSSLQEDRVVKRRPPKRQNLLRSPPSSLQEDRDDRMRVTSGRKGQLHSHCNQVQGQRGDPIEISTEKVGDPELKQRKQNPRRNQKPCQEDEVPIHFAAERELKKD
ncbi:hypothetical protein TNCV_444411 [Trichonephila clavipes]|nr:hypothetical protein TNCV_444411 [Trichonephila clavipes]